MTAVPLLDSQAIAYVPASAVLPSVHSFTTRSALPEPLLITGHSQTRIKSSHKYFPSSCETPIRPVHSPWVSVSHCLFTISKKEGL